MSEVKKISPWVWVSLLLIIGLFVTFILFLDQNIVKNGRQNSAVPTDSGVNTKPVFDFYTVLPQRKLDIQVPPERQQNHQSTLSKRKNPTQSASAKFLIQAGSFQRMQDADRRKAQLALLGLQATINTAQIKGHTYYRVEMGPFTDAQNSKIQRSLITNNLDFFAKSIP